MSRAKIVKLTPRAERAPELSSGLHPARVESREGDRFRVRTPGGAVYTAVLADDVEAAFVEECLAEGRTVLLSPSRGEVLILGALQSRRTTARDDHDTVRVEGRRIELVAEDGVSIKVGKSALRLTPSGDVRVVGQKMTMDVAEVVRILAAMCELP